jgi:hypothetical protein
MEISVERPGEVAQSGHRIDSAPKRSKPIGGSIQIEDRQFLENCVARERDSGKSTPRLMEYFLE